VADQLLFLVAVAPLVVILANAAHRPFVHQVCHAADPSVSLVAAFSRSEDLVSVILNATVAQAPPSMAPPGSPQLSHVSCASAQLFSILFV